MKKIIFLSFMSLINMATALTSLAAPTQAYVVSSVAETANDSTDDTLANVADEYVPTKAEYENLQYGEVIFWEGYEGRTTGKNVTTTNAPAVFNNTGASGITSVYFPDGVVSEDTELGIKYATVSGTKYLTFYGADSKAGTYTLVIRARKGTDSKFTAYIRGRDPSTKEDKNWASKNFTLTDEFTECVVSYNYTPSDAGYLNQTLPLFGNGIEIDSYAVYYKPFDNYERPEFGELVAWEGYETRAIGVEAYGYAAVCNSKTTSGVTAIDIIRGTVKAESPSGNRYIVAEGTVYYPGIYPSDSTGNAQAKAGVYTHVVRARKGATGTKMTPGIRTKRFDSASQSWKDDWGTSKTFTLTDEFEEYAISYNYVPSDTWHLKDLCFQVNVGVEIDSFALYYKPFEAPETINKASIRTEGVEGMRYAAFVDATRKSVATEYGFIIALGKSFTSEDDYSKLVFNSSFDVSGTNADGIKYVSGYNYLKGSDGVTVDKVFSSNGEVFGMDKEGTYFTAIIYNIKDYDAVLVGRPYLKISDGTVYYGEPIAKSIKGVAQDLVDQQYNGDVSTAPEFIQKVLG